MEYKIVQPQYLKGAVRVPASKSVAHRALFAAALSGRPVLLRDLDASRDVDATIQAFRQLGVCFTKRPDGLLADGSGLRRDSTVEIDADESGSTLRFIIPVVLALGNKATFRGASRLPQRPLDPYFRLFEKQHISYTHPKGSYLPLQTEGRLQTGYVEIEGDVSSQFITGLLLCGMLEDVTVRVTTPLQSKPYVDITMDVLRAFGCKPQELHNEYSVQKGLAVQAAYTVERDWSQAAFFLCAGAINGDVTVRDMNMDSCQGDRAIVGLLQQFGANITVSGNAIRAQKSAMHGITIDVGDIPDLVPVLSVVGCYAKGETVIRNAARLRLKESDRLAAMYETLTALGGSVEIGEDYLVLHGNGALRGGTVQAHNDHRVVMASAVAAAGASGAVTINGTEAVNKSYPAFFEDWSELYE